VFFMYPETHGRTLEELAFCEYFLFLFERSCGFNVGFEY